jgi:hypothetical protein
MSDKKPWGKGFKKYDVPEDAHKSLDLDAAIYQYGHGKRLEEAEELAHDKYMKSEFLKAAVHHYDLFNNAKKSNPEVAHQHAAAYAVALQKAGFNPHGPTPKEVLGHPRELDQSVKFKSHKMDQEATLIPKANKKA